MKTTQIEWIDNYIDDTIDPQDGGDPFIVWWDDMRPNEVRKLVKEAYMRGQIAKRKIIDIVSIKRNIENMLSDAKDLAEHLNSFSVLDLVEDYAEILLDLLDDA